MPYVNHYSFHILDLDWGHLTIKISGHPPFPAQVMLNGHEYVACQARKAGLTFAKDSNCFTAISDPPGLAKIADTLSEQAAIGRLGQVCERWIYTCLCFALDFDEQKRSGFRYQYSNYQIEYSRNLVFQVGVHLDQVFQALIDRSRAPLDLRTIKTILGYRRRPRSLSVRWSPSAVGTLIGVVLGLGAYHTFFYIVIPIMAGGVGEGAIPLSIGYSEILHQEQGVLFAQVLPPIMLGSLTAILLAGFLNWVGKRRPHLTGEGRLQRAADRDGSR
jgi:hypothetical protein